MGFLDRLKKKPKKEEKISGDWVDEMVEITKENAKRTPAAGGAIYTMPAKEYLSKREQFRAKKQNIGETIVEWHKKGIMALRSKNYEEAMKCFDKALELDPNVANSWFNKGQVFMHLENYEEAMHCFVKALELDYNHLDASFHKPLIHHPQGRKEESMQCLLHVIEFIERNVALPEIGAFDMLKPEERFYIQLLIDALNNQGIILATLGRHTEALICFERILELDPNGVSGVNVKNVINEFINE